MSSARSTRSAPLERDIQKAILSVLRSRPKSFTIKLAVGPYSLPGIPDILHLERGRPYFLEVKAEGGQLTRLQAATMDKLRAAGCVAVVVYSECEAMLLVDRGYSDAI